MSYNLKRKHLIGEDNVLSRRATSGTPFFISDSSPVFVYGPTTPISPWKPGFALQTDGYDETLHMSTTNGSTISFNVSATTLTLLIPSFQQCQSTVTLNSSSPIPACATTSTSSTSSNSSVPFTITNLPIGTHSIKYTTGNLPPSTQVVFWGVEGIRAIEPETNKNVTIDDSFDKPSEWVKLNWIGDWTHLPGVGGGGGGGGGGGSSSSEVASLKGDYNGTLSLTQTQGSSVTFSGAGSSIYVYGNVGTDYGSASVSLNRVVVSPYLNLTSPWAMPYELLWYRNGLNPSLVSNVTITNLVNKKMAIDFVVLTASGDVLSQLAAADPTKFLDKLVGKLVVYLLCPLLVLLIIISIILIIFGRRRKQRREANRQSGLHLEPSRESKRESGVSRAPSDASYNNGEVFVSYAEARGQQLSGRNFSNGSNNNHDDQLSPTSTGSLSRGLRNSDLPYMGGPTSISLQNISPVRSNPTGSPTSTRETWARPLSSLLYGRSRSRGTESVASTHGGPDRSTALPAYTPGENGTFSDATEGQGSPVSPDQGSEVQPNAGVGEVTGYITSQEEKMRLERVPNGFTGRSDTNTNTNTNTNTETNEEINFANINSPTGSGTNRDSRTDIISVLGAPPSEYRQRDSNATTNFSLSGSISEYGARGSIPFLPPLPSMGSFSGMGVGGRDSGISNNNNGFTPPPRPSQPRVDTTGIKQYNPNQYSPKSSQPSTSAHPFLSTQVGTLAGSNISTGSLIQSPAVEEEDWRDILRGGKARSDRDDLTR